MDTNNILIDAQNLFPYTQEMRRDFHQHPEVGFNEVRTSSIVAKELRKLNMEVTTGIAGTGVVGILDGAGPGPVVMLRFDMDALPIQENNSVDYASTNPGVMHACGHDGHTAVGLTVARLLHKQRQELKGTIKFVFQPAEEGLGGAQKMVDEGVLENPIPDYALAIHLWNYFPVGRLGITPGPIMAGIDKLKIQVVGKGGHGGVPDSTIDPLLASAHIVTSLQSIVSRNISPLETSVVSVCQIHGGNAFNIIPDTAELEGTIRYFTPEVHQKIWERIKSISTSIAQGLGCQANVELTNINRPVVNDEYVIQKVLSTAKSHFPDAQINTNYQTTVAEDMSEFLARVPGCLFFIGTANEDLGFNYPHHHPKFDIDEKALPGAAALVASSAIKLLEASS